MFSRYLRVVMQNRLFCENPTVSLTILISCAKLTSCTHTWNYARCESTTIQDSRSACNAIQRKRYTCCYQTHSLDQSTKRNCKCEVVWWIWCVSAQLDYHFYFQLKFRNGITGRNVCEKKKEEKIVKQRRQNVTTTTTTTTAPMTRLSTLTLKHQQKRFFRFAI